MRRFGPWIRGGRFNKDEIKGVDIRVEEASKVMVSYSSIAVNIDDFSTSQIMHAVSKPLIKSESIFEDSTRPISISKVVARSFSRRL